MRERTKPVRPAALLDWYDRHARQMPWRVGPAARKAGLRPDPYQVWLSEVMLQQTTVAAVRGYFQRFLQCWPTVQALAAAQDKDVMAAWAGLGYYARARNLLACAREVCTAYQGHFPRCESALRRLPGIGPYTAAAIAAIAFDAPATVVDGNVERVVARLYNIQTPLPVARPELRRLAVGLTPAERAGDYAQALMDLGATLCVPRRPACGLCPLRDACEGWHAGTAPGLPMKHPRPPKPMRWGVAYVVQRTDGAYLLERRAHKGLLGNMLGWPGSTWVEGKAPPHTPPIRADWQVMREEARHSFTHFHLRLQVKTACVPVGRRAGQGAFVPREDFDPKALPTVMRKVYNIGKTAMP